LQIHVGGNASGDLTENGSRNQTTLMLESRNPRIIDDDYANEGWVIGGHHSGE
jgi:hypothetical protein